MDASLNNGTTVSANETNPLNPNLFPVVTTGTSTAYVLTDTRIGSPVDGQVFSFLLHTPTGASPTLAVNGTTARALAYVIAGGGVIAVQPGQIPVALAVTCKYHAAGPWYMIESAYALRANNIPSTLGATTISQVRVGTGSYSIDIGSDTQGIGVYGSNITGASGMNARGASATGHGSVTLNCKMIAKAASTAYPYLWPVSANWHGSVWLIDDVMTGNTETQVVIKAGAIVAINGDTTCYKTTSPTGDQMQLAVSGGFLTGLTGNGYTRYLGINANRTGYK